jgi:hypothetical protein
LWGDQLYIRSAGGAPLKILEEYIQSHSRGWFGELEYLRSPATPGYFVEPGDCREVFKQNPPSPTDKGFGRVLNKNYEFREQNLSLNPPLQPHH